MAIDYEGAVAEDFTVGFGTATRKMPGGGTQTGNKMNPGRLNSRATKTFAASLSIDLVDGDWQVVTLTANVTDSTITVSSGSLFAGAELILELRQDATGGWLFNWPTNVRNAGTYPISTTASERTLTKMKYDGTDWIIVWSVIYS